MTFIFWGYFLIFFHLRINGFDLLPDFLGWALIAAGLNGLADKSEHFKQAKPWAAGLAVYTGIITAGQLFGMNFIGLVFIVINIIVFCVNLYISYSVACGVGDWERSTGQELGAGKLMEVWKVMAVLNIASSVLIRIPSEMILILAVILSVAALVANVVFLMRIYKVKKAYDNPNL